MFAVKSDRKRGNIIVVHQYKNNGYDIVLDVNSGAIHVVDDVTYDVIEMIDQSQPESYARAVSYTHLTLPTKA